jgi:hypothetical protein
MSLHRRSFLKLLPAGALAGVGCRRPGPAVVAPPDDPTRAAHPGKAALLVGVTRYDHGYRALRGPANDVALFRRVLRDTFGFPESAIVVLSEAEGPAGRPTRAHIHDAFRRLARAARPGDQVVILLSGHGAEQPDQTPPDPDDPEPNGMDQAFLPADAGRPDLGRKVIPNAIIDDDLRAWLAAVTDKGAHVFLVADCCHAGTLARSGHEEGERGVPTEQLWPPEVIEQARRQGAAARTALRGDEPPSLFKLDKGPALAALYACQPEQKTYEFPLPDPAGQPHGLLTWNVCQLLSEASSPLTYRELARLAHARTVRHYEESALARERMPVPFAEGAIDREVLGAKRWPGRSQLVLRRGDDGLAVTGGALHGLYPGAVLAVGPPAGGAAPDRLLGHVRVRSGDPFACRVEPCAFGGAPAAADLPDNARVRPVYLAHDLHRLRVWVGELPDADRRTLAPLMRADADDPHSLVEWVARRQDAGWAVRTFDARLWLLPAAADVREPASCRFALPRAGLAAALRGRLRQIARAANLLAVASARAGETQRGRGVAVEVEVRKLRDGNDGEGAPAAGRDVRLRGGDWVRYRVHNRGTTPADVTLLAVFSDYSIVSFFPEKAAATNNRVPPGRWAQTDALKVSCDTLGREHLVMIAVEGSGRQQVDFACLAEDDWEAARGARPSPSSGRARSMARGEAVFQTPLGRLFAHALFRQGQTRGAATAERYQMGLVSWLTLPEKAP